MRWAVTLPALRVAAKMAPFIVGRLDRLLDTLFGVLLAIHDFGSQRALAWFCSDCESASWPARAVVSRARVPSEPARAPLPRPHVIEIPPVRRCLRAFLFLSLIACHSAIAQSYPTKPIRLVLPLSPGSASNDILARALSQRLTEVLGQSVVADYRPDLGTIGSSQVARAPADGYTLLVGYTSSILIAPSVYPNPASIRTRTSLRSCASRPFLTASARIRRFRRKR